jgi:pSer/pThr/pTyr-binding forkhead associated (FHA) protein
MPIPVEILEYAGDADMAVTVRNGPDAPPLHIQLEHKEYAIGRAEDADIYIPAPSVSRQHARLLFLHGREIIEDLNSTNGILVNGVRVARCVLQDNDIIKIGDATVLFSRTVKPGSSRDET